MPMVTEGRNRCRTAENHASSRPSNSVSMVTIPVSGSSVPNRCQWSARKTVELIRPLAGKSPRYVENSRISIGPDQ